MDTLQTIVEVKDEGLEALLNENVLLFALNYIYAGKLVKVNDTSVQLADAKIVYETGAFSEKGYTNAQDLPGPFWNVQRSAIESYGLEK